MLLKKICRLLPSVSLSLPRLRILRRSMASDSDATRFDFLVIGGGSGGLAGARRAAELGANAAVIESHKLGGTCVNVGCVPKKVMWNAAVHAEYLHDHCDYGFETTSVRFSWEALKAKRDAYIAHLNRIYRNNLDKAKVTFIQGYARFTDDAEPTVEVNGKKYTAPHILISTGGQPSVLSDEEVPGASLGINSDGFFELETLPKRSVIVGAGYIAVEMAGILCTLGSKTSLIIRQTGVLRNFDALISANCTKEIQNNGIDLWKNSQVKSVCKTEKGLEVTIVTKDPDAKNDEKISVIEEVDCLLWAIGRQPNTAGLNIGGMGVDYRMKEDTSSWTTSRTPLDLASTLWEMFAAKLCSHLWPLLQAESWHTDCLRARRIPSWTTPAFPQWCSVTRPSVRWASQRRRLSNPKERRT
ncbi:Glutathione reductase, mitochondrial [Oryzias melastigma]|uniref:Glutathione reductase, mitochondrial n=1 Tax=Oryzias melastigma TaxID=30732 RepID=A0A834CGD5_ORYME|nr:Glutathione reductase, mitochondrial [Oryzias melastigma]